MNNSQLSEIIHSDERVASIIEEKCTVAQNGRGLIINTALDPQEFSTLLRHFDRWYDRIQWILGDLIAYGTSPEDPNRFNRIVELTGKKYPTVYKWCVTSTVFAPEDRIFDVKHTLYAEVATAAKLSQAERIHLLAAAQEEGCPTLELRNRIRDLVSAIDVEATTLPSSQALPSTVIGRRFEDFIAGLLHALHPDHAWQHLGAMKHNERGLDFLGRPFGTTSDKSKIGVQVKCHAPRQTPSEAEWLKFLAGCYARRVTDAYFITTGRLTSEQNREASEADVHVIAGIDEVNRRAKRLKLKPYSDQHRGS